MKIVFLGTPQIAVKSLTYLINKEDVEVVAVVTQPDKKAGRGQKVCTTPVCCAAQEYGIAVFQPDSIKKEPEVIEALKKLEPDFFVTFAFGQILSQEVIDIPKYGCVNLHASLLPKYRGANPIQSSIINGDKKTGITTMMTELSLDTGPIVLQEEISIKDEMVTPDLCQKISERSPGLIYRSLKGLMDGTIKPVAQDPELATYTPKLKKEDGEINWSDSAEVIHNKIRGMRPWPGTFTYINNTCMKIKEARLKDLSHAELDSASHELHFFDNQSKKTESLGQARNDKAHTPGQILGKASGGLIVQTGKGAIIITRVQPACKKEQEALAWFNGARLEPGARFLSEPPKEATECDTQCGI